MAKKITKRDLKKVTFKKPKDLEDDDDEDKFVNSEDEIGGSDAEMTGDENSDLDEIEVEDADQEGGGRRS